MAQVSDSSQSGVIRIRRSTPQDTAEAGERELLHAPDRPRAPLRRQGGIYQHGPVLGIDLLQDWGYRAGFQYSTSKLSTTMCFRHFPANKLAGISASTELTISRRGLRLGTEWTSMGQVNAWYHASSLFLSGILPSYRPYWPNTLFKVGYSLRLNKELDGIPLQSGFVFSLHFHL